MDKTELLNQTFMYLYAMEDPYTFPSAFEKKLNIGNANPIMLLDAIHDIGFADREKNTQQSGASQNLYNYWMNSNGFHFIEKLPTEFTNLPYTYHLKLNAEKDALKEVREETDHKLKQVTLGNISLHKYVSLLSLFVAIIAIATPIIINKIGENKTIKTESTIPQLNKIQETLQQEQKALQDILDSLRRK